MFEFLKYKCKNEHLFKVVVEATRSSLDVNKTKKTIIEVIGKALNADRCFIMEYDKTNDRFKESQDEYSSSPNMRSYVGVDLNEHIPNFVSEFKKGKRLIFNASRTQFDDYIVNLDDGSFEKEKITIEAYKVYSAVVFPIFYGDEFLGDLVVHYVDKKHKAGEEEIDLLSAVSNQIAIALHQAKLYQELKVQSNTQKTIINNIPFMAWLKDINGKYMVVNNKMAEAFNLKVEDILGKEDFDFTPFDLATKYREDDLEVIKQRKTKITEEWIIYKGKRMWSETFKSPIIDEDGNVLGTAGLAHDITDRKTAELELLERQKQILHASEREILLRKITEKIRSSLDIEEILSFICEETIKLFNVQRIALSQFPNPDNFDEFVIRKEYKTSNEIKGIAQAEGFSKAAAYVGRELIASGNTIMIDNVEESDTPEYFKKAYTSIGVKSIIGTAIKKGESIWGTLLLSEYNDFRSWNDEEKTLLEAIVTQVYIAINQAELYENQKNMAERERINRNIIEILRSSIDKAIIKKLFVKNIGKFFDADRVFFSEYDDKEKRYLPVDKDSEYLANPSEKSFIGYDWSKDSIKDYFQAILEKREVKIFSMEEYIKEKQVDGDIINLLEEAKVKSSYSFPVLYQDKIMGAFCLDFTQKNFKLSDEDIDRIRNMCTQAGVALYHAALYEAAQQCFKSKKIISSEFSEKIKKPANEILDKSTLLSENEFERGVQIEYLNAIINACSQLLDLTKNI